MPRRSPSMPIGAEPVDDDRFRFRVWAPKFDRLTAQIDGKRVTLEREADGYHSAILRCAPGARYGFSIGDRVLPDPASRYQPDGPHELSAVVDPHAFAWSDADWRGATLHGQFILEMHVGTFTPEGTWSAAMQKLPLLAEAGISIVEMMPVAEFPGRFGWGYDGVSLFAPTRLYGTPDDLRRFIDRAHALNLGVILDVVYNHLGPAGNYLPEFSDTYFTDRYKNEWGKPLNFDGSGSQGVREYICENAACWIREFHFDGLRLDATQQIFDASDEHVVAELTRKARAAANRRDIVMIAENEPQHARLIRPRERGGYGLDAVWNEDLHHTCHVALTGRAEAYYSDFTGSAEELVACAKHGVLYQGQRSSWQKKPRGSPSWGVKRSQHVNCLENHDQIANSGTGSRLIKVADPALLRAITAFALLMPGTPMLFQGEEFGSSTPFLYFADHEPKLGADVAKGRGEFLSQFPSVAGMTLDDPREEATFKKCVLDWSERERNTHVLKLYRDLIALKRTDPVLKAQDEIALDGAVFRGCIVLVRFYGPNGAGDRLLVLNLGKECVPRSLAEPLLAPSEGQEWRSIWSSEHPDYGGEGVCKTLSDDGSWRFCGRSAELFRSEASRD
jgi:maltooligosyltrehalose trehalohydrolase